MAANEGLTFQKALKYIYLYESRQSKDSLDNLAELLHDTPVASRSCLSTVVGEAFLQRERRLVVLSPRLKDHR